MLAVIDRIVAGFAALTTADVEALPPAERRRLADTCRYWAQVAEPKAPAPRSGVLAALRDRQS
jgi:hypothetical protein